MNSSQKAFYKNIKPFGFEKVLDTEFYEMKIGLFEGFAQPIPIRKGTPRVLLKCSLCDGIERRELGTAKITLEGKKPADIYQNVRLVLAGRKVQDIIRENKIVGVRFCDLDIEDNSQLDESHVSELRQMEILGRCYKVFSGDGQEIEHCPLCKRVQEDERIKADSGIQVVEDYWDGSDIFMFDYGLLSIIVTERVKEIFERNQISNVYFEPVLDLKMR
ncbi:MAG: hypothetical protein KAX49_20350 [Halanaerobiales bacterium]|nr:hypothetical protein [Halanaerobiales bacterium]